jgi:GMP synthase (glutamine-hydrolysing)
VLGVCFGHQLLASVLGATVRRNPLGREIGTVRCALSAAGRQDPLFDGVPDRFEVQATHEDSVFDPPGALELLAGNAHSAVQAFRAGRNLRGVQFHPEIDPAVMRALVEARAATLAGEAGARGADPAERVRALLAGIRPTPAGARILRNFVERCV